MADTFEFSQPENEPLPGLKKAIYGTGVDMPDPKPVNIDINHNLVGNFTTGPDPSKRNYNPNLGDDILSYMRQGDQWAFDKNRFAKTYDYGADWKHANFERYYSDPGFNKLGFSPYRDNDAHYNENTSAWDDFLRSMNGNLRLFGHGFISSEESGESSSEAMERINATYGSTRGGVGGFMSNLYLSAGYTQGIMSRVILEELALAAATVGSGFTASEVTIPAMGVEAVRAGRGIIQGIKGLGKTLSAFKQLDNIGKARQIFNAVKSVPRGLGRLVAPATSEFITGMRAAEGFKELKNYANVFKGVGSMYKDYREFSLAYSEASMEGHMLQNKMNDDLINQYYAEHGYMPQGEDAEKIYKTALNAGAANKMLNAGLIYGSNKIVFGKLFKGIPGAGELINKAIKSPLGTLKTMPVKLGENFYKIAKDGFLKTAGRSIISSPYSPLSKQYWLANITEGLQELGQDASAEGFEEYYKNIYKNPMQAGFVEMLESLANGTGKQFSEKGFETFASGFLTGALVGPGQYIATEVIPTHSRRLLPKNLREKWGVTSYEDLKKMKDEGRASMMNSVNEVLKNPYKLNVDAKDHLIEVIEHAKKVDEAYRSGDPVKIEEAKREMYTDHVHRVIRSGNADLLRNYFKKVNEMTDDELTEAFNQPLESAQELRTELKKRADKIDKYEKIYNAIESRFPNINDETIHKKGSPEYFAALRRQDSFEKAKKLAMFANSYFQDATTAQKDAMEYLANNKPLSKISATDVSNLFDMSAIDNEIEVLDKEIRVLKKGDAKQQKIAQQKQEKRTQLNNYKNSINFLDTVSQLSRKLDEEGVKELSSLGAISNGAVVKNKKGKEFTVVSTAGDVLTLQDEKGKKYTRKTRKGLEIVKEGEEVEMADKTNPVELATAEAYKHFKNYLKAIAEVNDEVLIDSNVDKAFEKLREFHHYKNTAKAMAGVVNVLHDPKGMMALAQRIETAKKSLDAQAETYYSDAYDAFADGKEYSSLLNQLYDKGFKLVKPDGIESLLKGEIPKQFIDEATDTIFDEKSNPTKYSAASKIVSGFLDFKKAEAEEKRKRAEEAELQKKADEKVKAPTAIVTEPPTEEEEKKKKKEEVKQKVETRKKIAYGTPYEQMPEELKLSIIQGARVVGIPEGVIDENATQEEIELSDWFRNEYLKYKHVENLIDKYNKKEGLSQATTPTTTVKPPTTTIKPTTTPTTAPVSSVERNPVIGDTLTSDSNQNYKIRGTTDKGGVQWENTKDGSKGVWSKERFDEYIKNGRLKYDIAAPVSDKKADIEKTLYGTLSGSRPLSEMIKDGIYIDLGNNMFAYVGKEGIAAIVNKDVIDNNGNYRTTKSFWVTKEKRWDIPNLANLKDDAKIYKLDEQAYIDKFQKATDKLNAELAALGEKEQKPAGKLTPMQQYNADKENKPASGLKPQIIYATSTTGKTALAKKYNDILDADFLLYEYLVEKGIVKEDTNPDTFENSVQKAGQEFFNYLSALKSANKIEARDKALSDIISRIQNLVEQEDKIVLTSNYWMRNQDMNRFVSKDVEGVAERLMARDPMMSRDKAMEAAKNLVEGETSSFKGRPFKEIPKDKTLEDMLFPKDEVDVQDKFIKRIGLANINELRAIEDELSNLSREDLLKVNFKELRQQINDRKIVLLRKFDFNSIVEGDTFMTKNGDFLTITYTTKNKLLGEIDDESGESIEITKDNIFEILDMRYVEGVIIDMPSEPASEEAKDAAKTTLANSNNISKTEDSEINEKSKKAKKGSGLDMLKDNKEDLNNNCPKTSKPL